MCSDDFVATQEMIDSDECPRNCPNLGGHFSNPWTCKICGNLCDTYDMGQDYNHPLKGDGCVLHYALHGRKIEVLGQLLKLVEGLDPIVVAIGELRRDEITDALRYAVEKVKR